MTDRQIQDALIDLLSGGELSDALIDLLGPGAESFEDAGVLTRDKGLVLRLRDRSEFQITIVQSRRGVNEPGPEDAFLDDNQEDESVD